MKKIIYLSSSRGNADYGWLKTHYSFSFSNYYNPERIHFGMLRVLNDDTIAAGKGFGEHPHDNMEIVTIPIEGSLAHKDSMGNSSVIKNGEVQIMSAGTGIFHSEFNASTIEQTRLFQIWVFPKEKNIQPRYDQKLFSIEERKNNFQTVVAPDKKNGALWINQDAFLSLGNFEKGRVEEYSIKYSGNGAFVFVIEGEIEIDGTKLERRDAMGISETEKISLKTNSNVEVLIIEVPMK